MTFNLHKNILSIKADSQAEQCQVDCLQRKFEAERVDFTLITLPKGITRHRNDWMLPVTSELILPLRYKKSLDIKA